MAVVSVHGVGDNKVVRMKDVEEIYGCRSSRSMTKEQVEGSDWIMLLMATVTAARRSTYWLIFNAKARKKTLLPAALYLATNQ